MCVTDRHDMTLAVKVLLNPNTTNQLPQGFYSLGICCKELLFAIQLTLSTAEHCFEDGYVVKKPVAWKKYCAEYSDKSPGKHG